MGITISPTRVGFALAARNTDVARNMTIALVHLEQQPVFQALGQEMFQWGSSCPSNEASDTAEVTFESMGGLFVICGVLAGLALLLGMIQGARRKLSKRSGDAE